jgi:cobalt/nickel transport system permease protein
VVDVHHVVVESWSRRTSPLHARDARAKLGALLVFLIAVSTTPPESQMAFAGYATLMVVAMLLARLPMAALLRRALLVLPFSATFALITWLGGYPMRAISLGEKSFLSGLAALLLVATTPLAELTRGLESVRVPRSLLLVIEFVYRYLFVISEQAQHMRLAARSRGSSFRASGGALAVLFARSWERADGIYYAMLARGFNGRFPSFSVARFAAQDAAFLILAAGAVIAIRVIA